MSIGSFIEVTARDGHRFHWCDARASFEPASAALAWQRSTDRLAEHAL